MKKRPSGRFFLLSIADIPVAAGGAAPAAAPLLAVIVEQQNSDRDADHSHGEQSNGEGFHRQLSFQSKLDFRFEDRVFEHRLIPADSQYWFERISQEQSKSESGYHFLRFHIWSIPSVTFQDVWQFPLVKGHGPCAIHEFWNTYESPHAYYNIT